MARRCEMRRRDELRRGVVKGSDERLGEAGEKR